ncbi:MAG: NAD-dependent epimerase/dehydratase family protein [Planctomycetota bacterium]|nr:NAD-dependent epimerase/dehydratase family protein [Planctomycetota bacterium]
MARILVTGATGLVGRHVVQRGLSLGHDIRALVRTTSDLSAVDVDQLEIVQGDLTDRSSLQSSLDNVNWVVHCAAKVGDWGPLEAYRTINVDALQTLLHIAHSSNIQRFVHISSLGVYEMRDHHGTDETVAPNVSGMDAYTQTKGEGEQLVMEQSRKTGLPIVVLRPGFIYGPGDRTVLPRVLEKLQTKQLTLFGSGEQLMNNTYVGNLVDAIFLSLEHPNAIGEVFNVTDNTLVSKRVFFNTIADMAGLPRVTKHLPLPVARILAGLMESLFKLLKKEEAPILSKARFKFLGLNLAFSIEKIRNTLGYQPSWSFEEGMRQSIDSFQNYGNDTSASQKDGTTAHSA